MPISRRPQKESEKAPFVFIDGTSLITGVDGVLLNAFPLKEIAKSPDTGETHATGMSMSPAPQYNVCGYVCCALARAAPKVSITATASAAASAHPAAAASALPRD